MSTAVANPRVTLNNISPQIRQGPDDQRVLIVAQMTSGSATPGVIDIDMPRSDAEINERYGADSHAAFLARWFRKINKVTNVDIKPLADDETATKGAATLLAVGTATREATINILVAGPDHRYTVDVLKADTPADVMTKMEARVNQDANRPFSFAASGAPVDTATFTAANGGNLSDDWPIVIEGHVPGMTFTLTGFTGGAGDPDIIGVFDDAADIRYQGIVWPSNYDRATITNFIEPRWNIDNDVKDGRAFIGVNGTLTELKAEALALDAKMVVLLGNEENDLADRKGPHLPEAPDLTAVYFTAVRALRFEDGISISHLVVTHQADDQFGGRHTASLPYFNIPSIYSRLPKRGTGFTQEEQLELEQAGITVVGANKSGTAVVFGAVVTTKLYDAAGNEENGSRYLNWIDTMSVVREYQVKNVRAEFAQARMTSGAGVARKSIMTEEDVRSFIIQLQQEQTEDALIVKGREARQWMKDNLSVVLVPGKRRVEMAEHALIVSQFGELSGSIEYSFDY